MFPMLLAPLLILPRLKFPNDPDPLPQEAVVVGVLLCAGGALGGGARLNPLVPDPPNPGVETDEAEADGGGCNEKEELVREVLDNWPRFIPPKALVGGAIEGEVTVDVGVDDDQGFTCACDCVAVPQLIPVPPVGEVIVEGVG